MSEENQKIEEQKVEDQKQTETEQQKENVVDVKEQAKEVAEQAKQELNATVDAVKQVKSIDDVKALPIKIKAIVAGGVVVFLLFLSMLFGGGDPFEGKYTLDLEAYDEKEAKAMAKMPEKFNHFYFDDGRFLLGGQEGVYKDVREEDGVYLMELSPDSHPDMSVTAQITITDRGLNFKAPGISRTKTGFHLKEK